MSKAEFKGARQLLLKDVTLQYTKVSRPIEYQGRMQWETSIITDDPKVAQDWEFNHLNVKGVPKLSPTSWTVSLNRKTETKDGAQQDPVRVVHADKTPYTEQERKQIGNGSKGNLIVWQGEYNNKWGTGVTSSLTAIQVTDLIKYEGGMEELDFDSFGEEGDKELSNAQAKAEVEDLF